MSGSRLRIVGGSTSNETVQEGEKQRSGGGGGSDDMELRVAALEKGFEKLEAGHTAILARLDGISQVLVEIRSEGRERMGVIDAKLDAKANADALERTSGEVRTSLEAMRGDLAQKATATHLSELKGGVDKLPTSFSLFLSLGGFIVAVFVAAGIAKHFGW